MGENMAVKHGVVRTRVSVIFCFLGQMRKQQIIAYSSWVVFVP